VFSLDCYLFDLGRCCLIVSLSAAKSYDKVIRHSFSDWSTFLGVEAFWGCFCLRPWRLYVAVVSVSCLVFDLNV
jgi:hypothetical protein